jgi:hypothetical protein
METIYEKITYTLELKNYGVIVVAGVNPNNGYKLKE